ncbi:hypothetical protein DFH06DRAFT_565131 [Mycena polygramma]|nr:hypothetical protein DFH06DRAFT_565131 [Mycena polygramma]
MPFFQSPSNFQIYGGHFTDVAGPSLQIGGDLNLHLAQPAMRQEDALEFALGEGTSRLLSGVERNGRRASTARMLPYDPSHRPHMRALQSSVDSSGVHDNHPWSMASGLVPSSSNPPLSRLASHPGIWADSGEYRHSHTPPSEPLHVATSSALAGSSAYMVSESTLPSDILDESAPQPMRPPFAGDLGSQLSLAPIANGPPWGGPPYGPKTNINVSGDINNIQRQGESGFHILHRAVAGDAFHDAAERYPQPKCHPETRTEMLEDLYQWSHSGSPILWLHGPAGAGKSAIAQSFCQTLETEHRLGAAFFFKRGDASRGRGNKLFPTIAYQLARSHPDLKQAISEVVEDDPSIVDRDLPTQVLKLMIEPCGRSIGRRNLVVVIDGLDECEGHHLQREILCSLDMIVRNQPISFRILVASRPEPHIQEVFRSPLNEIHRPLNIDQSFEDVQTYLVHEFRRIHREHWGTMATIPEPWPSSSIIEKLTDKSSGYFAYASTAIRFIDDRDFRPTERLDMIMGIQEAESESPFAALNELYIQIISSVPASKRPQLLGIMAVIAAKFHLSILHIEQLLELRSGDAHLILRHLHSVLDVPQHAPARIMVHHASFLDFLEDPTRSGEFHIGDPQRMDLARRILKAFSLNVDSGHVAWQFDQVEFEYVLSIQPTTDLASMLHSFNTDFLVFPNVHHVVRKVLSWLRRCQPLPHDVVKLWTNYEEIVNSGVWSQSRLKIRSEGIAGELELHRHFPRASAQLAKILFTRVRRPLDPADLSTAPAVDIGVENLADMEPSTAEDLAVSMHHFGHQWRGTTAASTLIFNKDAVQVYRKLVETNPSLNKDLASSLRGLGANLRAVGRREDAIDASREAVNLLRKLVETDPSVTEDLGSSLINLGCNLYMAGHYEAALCTDEEAVELFRKLAETNAATVILDLAISLHNLGLNLSALGRHEDAVQVGEELVQLHRLLAKIDPSFAKNLAHSLDHLGRDLAGSKLYKAAVRAHEEAVELHRKLTESDPSVAANLATSLHNLGRALSAAGQYEAAVHADEEAAALRRKLAQTDPSMTGDLAHSMYHVGDELSRRGQYEAAMQADKEAVELHRMLAETDTSIAQDLAWSLFNLGVDFRLIGRHHDALVVDTEAVEIRRKLAETDPTNTEYLAHSLENVALNLNAVGRHEDAASAAEEAIELLSTLLNRNVQTELSRANVLIHWSTYLRALDRQENSWRIYQNGADLHRKLGETDPEVTAESLCELAEDFSTTGLHEDALSAAEKSVELYRRLTPTKPALTRDLVEALGYWAKSLRALGREEDAARTEAEMATLEEEPAIEYAAKPYLVVGRD